MAGRFMDEMPGMSFGHAGTIVEGKEDTATEKIARLAEAGIVVAEEISEIPGHRQGADRERPGMRADGIFIGVEVDDAVARDPSSRPSSPRSAPSTSTPRTTTAASRSSRRTSTSACSAGCASTPRPPGTVSDLKLYDDGAVAGSRQGD